MFANIIIIPSQLKCVNPSIKSGTLRLVQTIMHYDTSNHDLAQNFHLKYFSNVVTN